MENNQLQLFNFKGANFTVILINDEPHWIGKEICDYLEIKNHSDAVSKLKEGSQKLKLGYEECKQIGVTDLKTLQIGTKGIVLLKEAGLYKLSFKSEKPNAEDFTDWISEEVLPALRKTGKFDSIEEKLKLIEDEKERELSLGLYSMQQALKANPNDYTVSILCNNKQLELNQYKQEKELKLIKEENEKLKIGQDEIKNKVENLFVIGDRTQFNNEVKAVARASGKQVNDIYTLTYNKLKDIYSIDLYARSINRKEEIQSERINNGGKPYSKETLNNKGGNLVLADELNIWLELGKSLMAVKTDLLS